MKQPPPSDLEEIREATRAMHEAMKEARGITRELRAATEDAKAVLTEIEVAAVVEVGDLLEKAVGESLTTWHETLGATIEDASDRVSARFDTIYQLLIDNLPAEKRHPDDPNLPEMLQQAGLIKPDVDLTVLTTPITAQAVGGPLTDTDLFTNTRRWRVENRYKPEEEEA